MEDSPGNDGCGGYADPVARLLNIGDTGNRDPAGWPDYAAQFGFGRAHIPELIRLACDGAFNEGDSDSSAVWGPMHAWRVLGQLRADAAVLPLLAYLKAFDEDDLAMQELPVVFGMIGPPAIPHITGFLSDPALPTIPAGTAMEGLKEIAARHPACREECIGILVKIIDSDVYADKSTNGFAVSSLIDMAAVEAIDPIRAAYGRKSVDISICGDVEDVELELGLRERRSTPAPVYQVLSMGGPARPDTGRIDWDSPAPAYGKVGRNDPCPCGSGKKYKKCCLQ